MGALHFSILNHQSITLATVLTEDSSALESEVKVLGELTGRIAKEADLILGFELEVWMIGWVRIDRVSIPQFWTMGQGFCPKLPC